MNIFKKQKDSLMKEYVMISDSMSTKGIAILFTFSVNEESSSQDTVYQC